MDINKPRFELTSIYNDGSAEEPKIVPINEMPWDTKANRRGFLGTGLLASSALFFLVKCKPNDLKQVPKINLDSNSTVDLKKAGRDDRLYAHCDQILALTISPDGKILVSAAQDKSIKLWSLPKGTLLKKIKGNSDSVLALTINQDGKMLASRSSDKIELMSLPEGKLLKTLIGNFINISVSKDWKILASRLSDKIEIWSLSDGILLKTIEGSFGSISLSLDGKLLAATTNFTSADNKNQIMTWSLPDGNLFKTQEIYYHIAALSFSPDGKILIGGTKAYSIIIWFVYEVDNFKRLESDNSTESLSISGDGKTLASGSSWKIELRSLPKGDLFKVLEGHFYSKNALFIDPDNGLLISGVVDKTLKIWSLFDGILLKTIGEWDLVKPNSYNSTPLLFAISPDKKILVTGVSGYSEGSIYLWDLEKEEFIGFLFDRACNETDGIIYEVHDKVTGITKTYTLPCGSPVPSGAICTCNCVGGTKPAYHPPPSYHSGGTYCTCDTVCTCIPVCQAHKLLHPDKFIRLLSREILLFMGLKEVDYMEWVAVNSKKKLKAAITSLIKKIKGGANLDYQSWPSIAECQQYLGHNDEVVSIMAAQMINLQHNIRQQPVSNDIYQTVESLLVKSEQMNWRRRLKPWI